jgi:hypothetical protein
MYADDAILHSTSVTGLQAQLNCCYDASLELLLKFDCNECICFCFGPATNTTLPNMFLGKDIIHWVDNIIYLGVTFVSGMHLVCDIDVITRKFHTASNCVFNNVNGLNDLLQLHLQQALSSNFAVWYSCRQVF